MNLEIRQATPAELPQVLAILNEVSAWLISIGLKQWPLPWPEDYIAGIIETGEMFLAFSKGQPSNQLLATFALRTSDEEPWGKQPPDALYVHHLAVSRLGSGEGVGRQILAWSADFARLQGKDYLRLDCVATNHFLQNYYKKAGFLHVGYFLNLQWEHKLCLFEMDLARDVMQ